MKNLQSPSHSRRWANLSYWLAWLALVFSLLYVIAAYGPGRAYYEMLYNSDAMFIPVFFRDIVAHATLEGWDLPTSPFFFPEMAIYFPILALFQEIHLAVTLYALIQVLLLVTGMFLLQRQLFGPSHFAQIFLLLTLTLCLLFIATGKQIFYPLALMSGAHTGALVVIPFATVLLLRALQPEQTVNERRRAILLLFAITLVTSLSETLFIIQFVLPACVATLLWGKHKQIAWRHLLIINGGLLLFAAVGQWLRQFVVPIDKIFLYTTSEKEAISSAFAKFVAWLYQDIRPDPFFVVFWMVSITALIAVILVCLRQRSLRQNEQEMRPLALAATLYLGSTIISIAATLVSSNFLDVYSTRYFLPTVYLPLMAGCPFFLAMWLFLYERQKANRLIAFATSLVSLLAIVYMLSTGQPLTLTAITEYQSSFMACLERETARRQIRYGLADYWQANRITALSEGTLQIMAVNADLSPYIWGNNRAWYQAPMEFVIKDEDASTAKEFVAQKFGQPADSFECENSEIYVYNRHSDAPIHHWFAHHPERAELDQVGDEAEFYGYTLDSWIGAVEVGLSLGASEEWDQVEGTLASAELKALPTGQYAVAFDLYADRTNTGAWEVITDTPAGKKLLATGPIAAAGRSVITGTFTLQEESKVEIGVKYNGHGALYLDKMRIKHVDPAQATSFVFAASPTSATALAQGTLSLIYPPPGASFDERAVDFVWRWTGQPLPPEQTFEVRLWPKGKSVHYGALDARTSAHLIRQIGDTYTLRFDLSGAYSVMQHGAGDYEWTVALVAIEPDYQDLQIEATPSSLSLLP